MDAIVIREVTKRFRKRTINREYTTFKSELVNLILRKGKKDRSHWIEVLKGIDLTVPKGKTIGIIGRNGSGKSTLLKLVNGIYGPTGGSITVNGRISALLELGAGFHPDFSGRENILINGIILGMSRAEIRKRMPEIMEFAELGEFIDEPVRTYSSGMYMRLAFAVATHVDPDILVIDEILAVGDQHFSKKSMAKMNEFKRAGKTIVLVTHDLGTVETWCDMAAWLDGGRIRDVGDPHSVVAHYKRVVSEEDAQRAEQKGTVASLAPQPRFGPAPEVGKRWGNFELEIASVRVARRDGHHAETFRPEDGLRVGLTWERQSEQPKVLFHVALLRHDGIEVYRAEHELDDVGERGALDLAIDHLPLVDGEYRLEVAARTGEGLVLDAQRELHGFVVKGGSTNKGIVRAGHAWAIGSGSEQLKGAANG